MTAPNTIILRPHTTEKAFSQSNADFGGRVYTFVVRDNANKVVVAREVKAAYGVTPIKVAIICVPSKRLRRRGRLGIRSGFKKALVYLKAGDSIQFA